MTIDATFTREIESRAYEPLAAAMRLKDKLENYGSVDKGHRANGFTTDGGFCEYQVNHINTLVGISDQMSDEDVVGLNIPTATRWAWSARGFSFFETSR